MSLENIEAEQHLLGALLLNNDVLHRVSDLAPSHFSEPVHGRIFAHARAAINAGGLASPVTLKFAMQDDEGLKQLGGPAYLARLAGATVALSNVGDFASLIREMWARRDMVAALAEAQERVQRADGGSVIEVAAEVERRMARNVEHSGAQPLTRSFLSSVTGAVQEVNAAYQQGTPPGIPTGLGALDALIGTMRPGRVYVLGGRPSMGKTAVAWNIVVRAAAAGTPVTFASLEMMDGDLSTRALSQLMRTDGLRVPYFDIENGRLTEDQMRAVVETAKANANLPIRYVTKDHRELSRLTLACRATQRTHKTGLIVIDYLQLIEVDGARDNFARVSAASKGVKRLAMDLGVPVLLLSQLSRGVEDRDDKRPRLSDLRASGEVEEDADAAIFAYRPEYYLERSKPAAGKHDEIGKHADELERMRNKLELIVAKQRSGPVGSAWLQCEVRYNFIDALADEPVAAQEAMDFAAL